MLQKIDKNREQIFNMWIRSATKACNTKHGKLITE